MQHDSFKAEFALNERGAWIAAVRFGHGVFCRVYTASSTVSVGFALAAALDIAEQSGVDSLTKCATEHATWSEARVAFGLDRIESPFS